MSRIENPKERQRYIGTWTTHEYRNPYRGGKAINTNQMTLRGRENEYGYETCTARIERKKRKEIV